MTDTALALPETAQHALSSWQFRYKDTTAEAALTDWTETTGADGRPVHSARIDHPDAFSLLTAFTVSDTINLISGVRGDQQRPFLDYGTPGRVACAWLWNGAWIVLWAPDGEQRPVPAPPRQTVTTARADVVTRASAKRLIPRPSGRLPFGRRNKTPKETTA